ncbi:MAG: methylated-DNA--[protein]-cysteine S-methyltransferase [Spirochaetota bacterium]|nr:MAG: methylated-DNA--[protein]-cysteine S-methyltransferase [Spirochaetota bacterium]
METDYQRIEKVIHYLEEHFQDQPSLSELAEYIHLSPFHFQRLFSRWAGISPKRFLQFLTIGYAKKLLAQDRTILDTTFETGLSSPGRLHDMFVAIDAITPGEYKMRGAGLEIDYGIHPSPFGECLIAATDRGICRLSFITGSKTVEAIAGLEKQWENAVLKENPQSTRLLKNQIFQPQSNNSKQPISLLLKGTNFQIKVWEALLRIPFGTLCSYEDVASFIGNPEAARAVGTAIAVNPIAYIIPCHRVIRKTGVFGNYGYGPARKKIMIGWEIAQKYRNEKSN